MCVHVCVCACVLVCGYHSVGHNHIWAMWIVDVTSGIIWGELGIQADPEVMLVRPLVRLLLPYLLQTQWLFHTTCFYLVNYDKIFAGILTLILAYFSSIFKNTEGIWREREESIEKNGMDIIISHNRFPAWLILVVIGLKFPPGIVKENSLFG